MGSNFESKLDQFMSEFDKENDSINESFPDVLPGMFASPKPRANDAVEEDEDLTFVDNLIFSLNAEFEDRTKAIERVAAGESPTLASPPASSLWKTERDAKTPKRLVTEEDIAEEESVTKEMTADEIHDYYQKEIEKLELEREEAIAEATSRTMEEYKEQVSSLQLKLSEVEKLYDEKVERLHREFESEVAKYDEENRARRSLLAALNQANETNEKLKEDLVALRSQNVTIDQLKEAIKRVTLEKEQAELQIKEEASMEFQAKLASLQSEIESARLAHDDRVKELTNEIKSLQKELGMTARERDDLQKELEKALQDLESALSRQQQSLDTTDLEAKFQAQIEDLRKEKTNEVSFVRKQVSASFEDRLNELNNQTVRLQTLLTAEHKYSFEIKAQFKSLEQDYEESQRDIDDLHHEFAEVHEEFAHVTMERDEAIHRVQELEQDVEHLSLSKRELEEELQESRGDLELLQGEMDHLNSELSRVIEERDDAVRVIGELQMKCDELDTEIIETFEDMEEQHEEFDSKVSSLESEIVRLKSEIGEAQMGSNSLGGENILLVARISGLEKALEHANLELVEAKKEREKQVAAILEDIINRSVNLLRIVRELKRARSPMLPSSEKDSSVVENKAKKESNDMQPEIPSKTTAAEIDANAPIETGKIVQDIECGGASATGNSTTKIDQAAKDRVSKGEDLSTVMPSIENQTQKTETGIPGTVSSRKKPIIRQSRLLQPTSASAAKEIQSNLSAPKSRIASVTKSKSTVSKLPSVKSRVGAAKQKSLLQKYTSSGSTSIPVRSTALPTNPQSHSTQGLKTPNPRKLGSSQTTSRKKMQTRIPLSQQQTASSARKVSGIPRPTPAKAKNTVSSTTKVSPKDLIQNVIESLSPEKSTNQTDDPLMTPASKRTVEKIETPMEKVDQKFQSLFTNWSVSKARPQRTPTTLPDSLRMNWTTTANAKSNIVTQKEFHTSVRKPRRSPAESLKTPSHRLFAQESPKLNGDCTTPYVPKDFMDALLSPEELLISPTAGKPATSRKASFSKHHGAASRLQAIVRSYLATKEYKRMQAAILILQGFVRMARPLTDRKQAIKSALTLQTFTRSYLSRKEYATIRSSCLLIQSLARMLPERRQLRESIRSVVKIQTFLRSNAAQRQRKTIINAVSDIQTVWRYKAQRIRFLKFRSATIIIQKTARARISRRKFQLALASSICIQSCWRATLSRRRATLLIEQAAVRETLVQLEEASIKIQSLFRMNEAVRMLTSSKSSATRIQAIVRSMKAQRFYREHVQASAKIQALFRGAISRAYAKAAIVAIVRIQSLVRRVLCSNRSTERRNALLIIQQWARGKVSLIRQFKEEWQCDAAVLIQSHFRALMAKKSYLVLKAYKAEQAAAVTLQRCIRSYLAKEIHQREVRVVCAATLLQSFFRSIIASKFLASLKEEREARVEHAAIRLQSFFRSVIASKLMVSLKETRIQSRMLQAALSIQRGWKTYNIQKQQLLEEKAHASNVVQTWWRAVKSRRALRDGLKAIRTIQRYYRGYSDRSTFSDRLLEFRAAAKIQSIARSFARRKTFETHKKSIVVIQTAYRGRVARSVLAKKLAEAENARDKMARKVSRTPLKPVDPKTKIQKSGILSNRKEYRGTPAPAFLSPLKTRRGTVIDSENSENHNTNVPFRRPTTLKKVTRAETSDIVSPVQGISSRMDSNIAAKSNALDRMSIEEMRVVDLKEELISLGVEKRTLRPLRKADLIELLIDQRKKLS